VRFFGASGDLPDPAQQDAVMLTVQNVSKKTSSITMWTHRWHCSGQRPVGSTGAITATITVTNSTPDASREYITGPTVRGQPYAVYGGIVSLYVPTGTTLVGSSGSDSPPASPRRTDAPW